MPASDDAQLPTAVAARAAARVATGEAARGAAATGDERAAPGSPIDVATRAFDAGLLIDAAREAPLATLDIAGGAVRLEVAGAATFLTREPLTAGTLGDGCAERRVRGERDASPAAREAERARAVRESAVLKQQLERLDG